VKSQPVATSSTSLESSIGAMLRTSRTSGTYDVLSAPASAADWEPQHLISSVPTTPHRWYDVGPDRIRSGTTPRSMDIGESTRLLFPSPKRSPQHHQDRPESAHELPLLTENSETSESTVGTGRLRSCDCCVPLPSAPMRL